MKRTLVSDGLFAVVLFVCISVLAHMAPMAFAKVMPSDVGITIATVKCDGPGCPDEPEEEEETVAHFKVKKPARGNTVDQIILAKEVDEWDCTSGTCVKTGTVTVPD